MIEVIGSTHKDMSSISVYPNPATEKTMFAFFAHNAAKTIREVFDMTGSRVADVFVGTVEAGIR